MSVVYVIIIDSLWYHHWHQRRFYFSIVERSREIMWQSQFPHPNIVLFIEHNVNRLKDLNVL